jgi:hypothetical protein
MTWQGNLDLKENENFCGVLERGMPFDRQAGACYSQLKQLANQEKIMVSVLDIQERQNSV